jgi:hypothetical protein
MTIVLVCIVTLGFGGVVSADDTMFQSPVPTPFPPPQWWEDDSSWFYYAEDQLFHWGPALYYEKPVLVNYTVEGRDFFISKGNYHNLQLRGTAKVYEALGAGNEAEPGELMDESLFKVKITFRDPQNTWGWPPRGWWPVSYIMYRYEQFDMNWTIPGVYRADITCKDGHWTIAFVVHTAPPVTGGMFPNSAPWEFDAPIP